VSAAGIAAAAGALIFGRKLWRDRNTQASIKKEIKRRFNTEGKNPFKNGNGSNNFQDEE